MQSRAKRDDGRGDGRDDACPDHPRGVILLCCMKELEVAEMLENVLFHDCYRLVTKRIQKDAKKNFVKFGRRRYALNFGLTIENAVELAGGCEKIFIFEISRLYFEIAWWLQQGKSSISRLLSFETISRSIG